MKLAALGGILRKSSQSTFVTASCDPMAYNADGAKRQADAVRGEILTRAGHGFPNSAESCRIPALSAVAASVLISKERTGGDLGSGG